MSFYRNTGVLSSNNGFILALFDSNVCFIGHK